MAVKQGGGKKKRDSKKSAGVNGAGGKTTLTELQKVLISSTKASRFHAISAREQNRG